MKLSKDDFYEILTPTLSLIILSACIVALMLILTGCDQKKIKSVQAETVYLAQQLRCVDTYNTNEAINQCRLRVRNNWGITETVKDGGAP